jgi:iron complex outermembrane receptor protein
MDAYEIGLKSSLFDRRVRLNLSAFFNRYKALQLGILSCPQYSPPGLGNLCAVIQNAGNADVKGIEAETEIHPFEGAMIDGSISYLDFDYTYIDPNAGGPDRPGGPQKGDVRPYSPKWKWSIGAQYSIDLGEAGSLTPRVDGSYTSEVYSAARNTATSRIAGYTVFNARLTYKDRSDKWEASLEVTNFTNKLYYVINADLSSFAGFTWGTPARPREWALTLTRRF